MKFKYIRWLCTGIGYGVVLLALLGAVLDGVNFRMCFGPKATCRLITEPPP